RRFRDRPTERNGAFSAPTPHFPAGISTVPTVSCDCPANAPERQGRNRITDFADPLESDSFGWQKRGSDAANCATGETTWQPNPLSIARPFAITASWNVTKLALNYRGAK